MRLVPIVERCLIESDLHRVSEFLEREDPKELTLLQALANRIVSRLERLTDFDSAKGTAPGKVKRLDLPPEIPPDLLSLEALSET